MDNIQSPAGGDDQSIEREILAKGKTAPRISPKRIEKAIKHRFFFTAAQGIESRRDLPLPALHVDDANSLSSLIICVLVLENGFTVSGESACASPENFDAEIGRKIAFENAKQKIWALEGYQVKTRLHEAAVRDAVMIKLED